MLKQFGSGSLERGLQHLRNTESALEEVSTLIHVSTAVSLSPNQLQAVTRHSDVLIVLLQSAADVSPAMRTALLLFGCGGSSCSQGCFD